MRRFLTRLWGANALAWIALAALAGIYFADWSAARLPITAAWAFGIATATAGAWFWRGEKRPAAMLPLAAAAFGFAHLLTASAHRTVPLLDRIEAGERLYVEVEGVVDDLPRVAGEEKSEFIVPLRLGSVREIGKDKVWAGRRPDPPRRLRAASALRG